LPQIVARHPKLDPSRVDDVILGDANAAGEDNRNVARMAAILAGFPTSVPGSTVNRLCGSGLEAVIQASRAIETGDAELILAGGVESMSRAPWVVLKPSRAYPSTHETMHSTTLGWRMVNPEMPSQWSIPLGETAEILADRYSISREEQDAFTLASHLNAAAAWDAGIYDGEVIPVSGAALDRDEGIRGDASRGALAALRPAFRAEGTVTAGSSSPLTDGAGALIIGSEKAPVSSGRRRRRSGPSPWRESSRAVLRVTTRTCSASPPSKQRTGRWPRRARPGQTSTSSS